MYRQILLDHTQTSLKQKITFRENVNEPIHDFEFRTVTFGVNSAPFLARKVASAHPLASEVLLNRMCGDDVLAVAHCFQYNIH